MELGKISALLLLCLSLGTACTRTAEKTKLQDAKLELGPINQDAEIDLKERATVDMKSALKLEAELSTPAFLRLAEDLSWIAQDQNSESIDKLSSDLFRNYRSRLERKIKLSESLYAQALVGEAEPDALKEVDILSKNLDLAAAEVEKLLLLSQENFSWPRSFKNFQEVIPAADAYLAYLNGGFRKIGMKNEVAKPVAAAINNKFKNYRPKIVKAAQRLDGARTFKETMSILNGTIRELGLDVDGEIGTQLRKGNQLVQSLDTMSTAQDTLVLIIFLWKMVPAQERKAVFYKSAPEIYDFLAERGEVSLECLQQSFCLNPILELAKHFAIYPKIEEYGIGTIRTKIDQAARQYLVKKILSEAVAIGPRLPLLIRKELMKEAATYQKLVRNIQQNFGGFAQKAVSQWEKKEFPVAMRGLDPDRLRVKLSGSTSLQLALLNPGKAGTETGAETLGMSMATAHHYLPTDPLQLRAALLEPILKVLAVSGFRKAGGKQFPSMLFPLDGKKEEILNIRDLLAGKTSFAVPDKFVANENFILNRDLAKPNVSVAAQAELIRGISKQIAMVKDWEKTAFDDSLSKFQVEDLVKEIPVGAVGISAFPKDIIFTISIATAGAILQNIVLDLSPAFLMLPDGRLIWGKEYEEIGKGPENTSAIAGLVNIENGKKGKIVKTADIARYILALDEFQRATEGLEKTASKQLQKVNSKGKTLVEQLVEVRGYMRLMQAALSNYLVIIAQDKDGGFYGQSTLDGKILKPEGPRYLEDQALAVRALVASSYTLQLPPFLWAAMDSYYFTNRSLWDKEKQFYANSVSAEGIKSGKPNLLEIVSTLRSFHELAPSMETDVRAQWDRIALPWQKALEEF